MDCGQFKDERQADGLPRQFRVHAGHNIIRLCSPPFHFVVKRFETFPGVSGQLQVDGLEVRERGFRQLEGKTASRANPHSRCTQISEYLRRSKVTPDVVACSTRIGGPFIGINGRVSLRAEYFAGSHRNRDRWSATNVFPDDFRSTMSVSAP